MSIFATCSSYEFLFLPFEKEEDDTRCTYVPRTCEIIADMKEIFINVNESKIEVSSSR